MFKPKYITRLDHVDGLERCEAARLEEVCETYAFRSNEYYQSLIDWSDPDDPIRRIVIPSEMELDEERSRELDASGEEAYTMRPGLQHKYGQTALLLVNNVCGAYCRFCFRKRLFMDENDEVARDISSDLDYIRRHEEIDNVVLSGGDPLILSTSKLERIISELRDIYHVKVIRIGSKLPAFNPFRIINDPSLLEMIARYTEPERKIYISVHFNHPRELTPVAVRALNMLLDAGAILVNQTPLLKGINDDPDTLEELFNRLSYIGVPPYYLFQCRPTRGNEMFSVPIEEGIEIFDEVRSRCSGIAERARYVMSHYTGKVEILGKAEGKVIFRYHRSPNMDDFGSLMVFDSNPDALWLDDYEDSDGFAVEGVYDYGEED